MASTLLITNKSDRSTDGATITAILNNSPSGVKPHAIGISDVILSHSFPNITQYNNTLAYEWVGQTSGVATIVPGQYTTDQFIEALNAQMPDVGSGSQWSIAPRTESNPFDAKLQFTNIDGTGNYIFSPSPLSSVMGLPTDEDWIAPINTTTIAPYQSDLGGHRVVYINSKRISQGGAVDTSGRRADIIESVFLGDVPYGGCAVKQVDDRQINMCHYKSEEHMNTIDFFITDSLGRHLSLPPNATFDIKMRTYHSEDMKHAAVSF